MCIKRSAFGYLKSGYGNSLWDTHHMQNVPIHIDYKGRHLKGVADPIEINMEDGIPRSHSIYLNGKYIGTLSCAKEGWVMDRPVDVDLVETLSEYLHAWYE